MAIGTSVSLFQDLCSIKAEESVSSLESCSLSSHLVFLSVSRFSSYSIGKNSKIGMQIGGISLRGFERIRGPLLPIFSVTDVCD